MGYLKLDLGCGGCKKEGTIGIDVQAQLGVDHVLDMENEPLPFPNQSVDYVYSSHCLEHLIEPVKLFLEISRVCIDGAKLEFWTPYNWDNSAFVFGHKSYFNEDHYMHTCVWFSSFWEKIFHVRWLLKEFTYVIDQDILIELYQNKIDLNFALRHYKSVAREFCTHIEIRRNYVGETLLPQKTFATSRVSQKFIVKSKPKIETSLEELQRAINYYSL